MRAAILAACLMTAGSLPVAYARWSDPATWGGTVPTSGPVTVPVGTTVLVDVNLSGYSQVNFFGAGVVDLEIDTGIQGANIVIGPSGALHCGHEYARLPADKTLHLTLDGPEVGRTPRFVPVHDNPISGKGKPARLAVGTGVAAGEVITLTLNNPPTTFSAVSSIAGAMPSGTVGTYYSSWVQFMLTAGSTPWVAGDTIVISCGSQMGFTNDGVGRSLQVMPGGTLKLFGAIKTGTAILNASAPPGATTIELESVPVGWRNGDKIVVGGSDFYETASGAPQEVTIVGDVTTKFVTFTPALSAARYGALQYATDTGISLAPGAFTLAGMKRYADTPEVLDERARVINKTRNIVIQGANDSAWTSGKFGAHCMVMGLSSVVQLDGVEFRRVGQAGAIGRYPIHWHMLSYGGQQGGDVARLPSDGTFLGAIPVGNAYLRNCSIHTSGQRGTVIHGTHGVELTGNVFHDITAHCIFLEDGAEQDNIIKANTVFDVKQQADANILLEHERPSYVNGEITLNGTFSGAAGIWFSHPNNTLEDNYVAHCHGTGIWNTFGARSVGLCIEVPGPTPREVPLKSHYNNWTVGNRIFGMQTSQHAANSRGQLEAHDYKPATATEESEIVGAHISKNGRAGYHNQVHRPKYRNWVVSGNRGMDLLGRTVMISEVTGLFVGTSLNNATPPDESSPYGPRASMASYHFLVQAGGSYYNYPLKTSTVLGDNVIGSTFSVGGVMRSSDLYLEGVEPGLAFTQNVKMHNTGFMYHVLPSPQNGLTEIDQGWTLSQAIWDKNGIMGPPESYIIYDDPFLTYDLHPSAVPLVGQPGYSTPSRFISVGWYGSGDDWTAANPRPGNTTKWNYRKTVTHRLDASLNSVGSWLVSASPAYRGPNNPAFAMMLGGRYRMTFPDGVLPTQWASIPFGHANAAGESVIFGYPWAGSTLSGGYVTSDLNGISNEYAQAAAEHPTQIKLDYNQARLLAVVTSMASLESATVPSCYLDTSRQTVWIKHIGGLVIGGFNPNNPETYYRGIVYRINA